MRNMVTGHFAPTQKHSEDKGEEVDEVASGSDKEEEQQVKCDEGEEQYPPVTPLKISPLRTSDPMRTPRLSDFGLSEHNLMKAWSNLEKPLGEAPEVPQLMPFSMAAVSQPVPPKTPKCTLRMDEEALTPRLEDFGISEHTMCLNNDFTMDLLRKNNTKPSSMTARSKNPERGPKTDCRESSALPPASVTSSPDASDSMGTPEPPVLMTPGFKLKKIPEPMTPLPSNAVDSQPPLHSADHPSTPEIPVFETPYVHKLLSTVKPNQRDHSDAAAAPEQRPDAPAYQPPNRGPDMSGDWACGIPDMSVRPSHQSDTHTPEMPNLESFLGNKLPHRTTGAYEKLPPAEKGDGEQFGLNGPPLPAVEDEDIYTQEWRLATPPSRSDYMTDPSTPEMPDVSSVTQDIFKLLSQCNTKPSTTSHSNLKPATQPVPKTATLKASTLGKENRAHSLALVSEKEFLSLPGYLRQMPLTNLNQAIQNINSALEGSHSGGNADSAAFLMEDLERITGAGVKASVYFLCLTGLKRLEHVQGQGKSALYRVLISN
ncbi:hypothetical protein AGOR_G00064850 [Albula goreensis]|uniref:Spindle and kinetochore-associated protein 3 n=1 Tax=Albula goreensis TaxID=1534307 RepID=A0A8T3DYI7_9TELE|nr:hypothetical protein AGOR_G00064850 [Albula goreensis]